MIETGRAGAGMAGMAAPSPRAGATAIVLVAGEDTGGLFSAVEIGAVPGTEPPLHLHTREDELAYVLEGEVVFHLGGERLPRSSGACVLLPRGRDHTYSVRSEEARLLVLLIPAGLEGFYGELDDDGAGASPDLERLVTVAARYGVEITGPPPGTGYDGRRRMEQA